MEKKKREIEDRSMTQTPEDDKMTMMTFIRSPKMFHVPVPSHRIDCASFETLLR